GGNSSPRRRATGSAWRPPSVGSSPDSDPGDAPMKIARQLSVRLRSLFTRQRLERELDTELRYHVDMLVEQNIAKGMTPDSARREALRVFGTVEGVKDDVRDKWLSRLFETAAQDVRYGVRSLRRNKGFALVII